MERAEASPQRAIKASAEGLPDLKPWREAGWIFRDGGCIAIERNGDETRARVLVD
jgi:hypothetical protein